MNPFVKYFLHLRNAIDFSLRSLCSFSMPYKGKTEHKTTLFHNFSREKQKPAAALESLMRTKYSLNALYSASINLDYLDNLRVLELLEKSRISPSGAATIRVLDIGSKYFSYAPALHAFFSQLHVGKPILLTGIEIDAYRRFTDFHTRYDYAKQAIRDIPGARYVAGDVLKHTGTYECITWFYPFVFEFAHLKWGLPLNHLKPRDMLTHAYKLLALGGSMIVVNQSLEEKETHDTMCAALSIPYTSVGSLQSSFREKNTLRYITVIEKS